MTRLRIPGLYAYRWWIPTGMLLVLILAFADVTVSKMLTESGVAARVEGTDLDDLIVDDFNEPKQPHPTNKLSRAYWVDRVSEFRLKRLVILPGTFLFVTTSAVVVGVVHASRWRAGLLVLFANASGILINVLKWAAGRTRPGKGVGAFDWHPFRGGFHGLFDQANLSFPSGHTALAFAWATMISLLFPRLRWASFGWAFLVGVERVVENAHYLTDAAAAALVGIVTALVAARILTRFLERPAATETYSSAARDSDRPLHPTDA